MLRSIFCVAAVAVLAGLSNCSAQSAPRWNDLDNIVVTQLNARHSVEYINRFFTTLSGYEGPSTDGGTVIGEAVFFSDPIHDTPNYLLAPAAGTAPYLFGVFNDELNGKGRVSVYSKRGDRWARTSRFDSDKPISLYQLSAPDGFLPLISVETFTGGDHSDGYLKGWLVKDGKLVRQELRTGKLMDVYIEKADGVVVAVYQEYPGLNEGFLGKRIEYRLTISAPDGRIQVDTVFLNPWLKVVRDFYEHLEAGSLAKAERLLENPSLLRTLRFDSPSLMRDDGNLDAGTGFVVLMKEPDEYFRVSVTRNRFAQWRITSVTKIEKP